ncbi:MAG: hypothetical protein OEW05_07425, partial [Candidatus Aminicenantes bacterium]|nr:hypothetical protein [Candidatus Aminicenantes bacterium]
MRRKLAILMSVLFMLAALPWGAGTARAQQARDARGWNQQNRLKTKFLANAQRKAAGARFRQLWSAAQAAGGAVPRAAQM